MFLYLLLAIAICGIMSAIITVITRVLPSRIFSPFRRRFKVYESENTIYNKLKVKKWKDKIPELGKLGGFAKNKISEPNNPKYIFKFLTEMCIAEALHFYSIVAGLLVFIFLPQEYILSISLPVFILNTLLHGMPIIVQRYLRPKFLKIYKRLTIKDDLQIENELKEVNERSA